MYSNEQEKRFLDLATQFQNNEISEHDIDLLREVIEYADSLCYNNISYAHQDEQLGTGHAVNQTKPLLDNFEGNVLILAVFSSSSYKIK